MSLFSEQQVGKLGTSSSFWGLGASAPPFCEGDRDTGPQECLGTGLRAAGVGWDMLLSLSPAKRET